MTFSFLDRPKRKPHPPKPMHIVINPATGRRVEIPQDMYDSWLHEINGVLEKQVLCLNCRCGECTQPIPYYVQVIQQCYGGYTIAVRACPHHRRAHLEITHSTQQEQELRKLDIGPEYAIPPRYQNLTLSDFQVIPQNNKAIELVKGFMQSKKPERGLFLTGPKGTGKTMLACIIAGEKSREGKQIMFQDMGELQDALTSESETKINKILKLLKEVPILVLDDIGVSALTESTAVDLATVVNYRYAHKLPMVITSNYTMSELQVALNPKGALQGKDLQTSAVRRIISRLAQCSTIVYVHGKDHRILDQMQRLNTGLFG